MGHAPLPNFAAQYSALERISAITRHKLRKLLKYCLVTAAIGAVLTLLSGHGGSRFLLGWVLLGTWTCILKSFSSAGDSGRWPYLFSFWARPWP